MVLHIWPCAILCYYIRYQFALYAKIKSYSSFLACKYKFKFVVIVSYLYTLFALIFIFSLIRLRRILVYPTQPWNCQAKLTIWLSVGDYFEEGLLYLEKNGLSLNVLLQVLFDSKYHPLLRFAPSPLLIIHYSTPPCLAHSKSYTIESNRLFFSLLQELWASLFLAFLHSSSSWCSDTIWLLYAEYSLVRLYPF